MMRSQKIMKPPERLVKQFQQTYLEVFGEEIPYEEAYDRFTQLADVVRILRSPKPKKQGNKRDLP